MFRPKTLLLATLLALQALAVPTLPKIEIEPLKKRQSTAVAFSVPRGGFRMPYLGDAPLAIQTFWKPSNDPTNIVLTHTNITGSTPGSASDNRYMHISFRSRDGKIVINSQYNGVWKTEKETNFTLAQATFEANPDTKERLIRMSIQRTIANSWVITFLTNIPGYGEDQISNTVNFTPHNSVLTAGIEPNYIWYQDTGSPHLSLELQCGTSWW